MDKGWKRQKTPSWRIAMYEKMNVDAMNEAIEDYNKKNFFQKLRIWRNKMFLCSRLFLPFFMT